MFDQIIALFSSPNIILIISYIAALSGALAVISAQYSRSLRYRKRQQQWDAIWRDSLQDEKDKIEQLQKTVLSLQDEKSYEDHNDLLSELGMGYGDLIDKYYKDQTCIDWISEDKDLNLSGFQSHTKRRNIISNIKEKIKAIIKNKSRQKHKASDYTDLNKSIDRLYSLVEDEINHIESRLPNK